MPCHKAEGRKKDERASQLQLVRFPIFSFWICLKQYFWKSLICQVREREREVGISYISHSSFIPHQTFSHYTSLNLAKTKSSCAVFWFRRIFHWKIHLIKKILPSEWMHCNLKQFPVVTELQIHLSWTSGLSSPWTACLYWYQGNSTTSVQNHAA